MASRSKAIVIGLDGAAPEWVLDRWLGELPTFRSLTRRGAYGILRSCDPPVTVPAWSVMTSSRSPGALGLYGFRNRRTYGYDPLVLADSRCVRVPRVWDILSRRGRRVIVLGVPQTYPLNPVNGVMVSCFMSPDGERTPYTYPPNLAREIDGVVGRYSRGRRGRPDGGQGRPARADRGGDRQALLPGRAPSGNAAPGPLLHGRDGHRSHPARLPSLLRPGAGSTSPGTGTRAPSSTTTEDSTRGWRGSSASRMTRRPSSSSPTTARSGWTARSP